MELHARPDADGAWVMTLHGELDLAEVPAFRSATREALRDGWSHVVVDLGSVALIDSAGIGVLIGLRRRVNEANGTLTVRTNEGVSRILEAAGVAALFDVESGASLNSTGRGS